MPIVRVNKKSPNRRLLKKKIESIIDAMYVNNPGMRTDIDAYNYGIHDAYKQIKKLL